MPIALQCDISVFSFWEMTLGEIIKTIEAYKKKEKYVLKNKATMDFCLAKAIGGNIASLLSEENKPAEFMNIYDWLFEEENKEIQKKKIENELIINKQRMKDFAVYFNSHRKEGNR